MLKFVKSTTVRPRLRCQRFSGDIFVGTQDTHTRVALHELAEAKIQFCKGTENKRKEEISTMAMSGHISSFICYETILFHG